MVDLYSLLLVVIVQAAADVLDDSLRRIGGTGDDIHLLGGSLLGGETVPLAEEVSLDECPVLGCLHVLQRFNLLNLVLLDKDLQRRGAGIALHIVCKGGGVDDGCSVLLGDYFSGLSVQRQTRK